MRPVAGETKTSEFEKVATRPVYLPFSTSTIAQHPATFAHRLKDHRCGLSAIQRVIHFDRSVIARDIRATIAFQLILVDESTVSRCCVKHLSCQPLGRSRPRSGCRCQEKDEIPMRRFTVVTIVEG
jgi:hypothetical protein